MALKVPAKCFEIGRGKQHAFSLSLPPTRSSISTLERVDVQIVNRENWNAQSHFSHPLPTANKGTSRRKIGNFKIRSGSDKPRYRIFVSKSGRLHATLQHSAIFHARRGTDSSKRSWVGNHLVEAIQGLNHLQADDLAGCAGRTILTQSSIFIPDLCGTVMLQAGAGRDGTGRIV